MKELLPSRTTLAKASINFQTFLLLLFLLPFTNLAHCQDSIRIAFINQSFLGNFQRNYYGNEAPDKLNVKWHLYLGEGETVISRKLGSRLWKGAGWTGQPLMIEEDSALYLIQGCYDHHLKKINAKTGTLVWQYQFDDVIKGTGTIWEDTSATDQKNRYIIFQGSRLGVGNYLDSKHIPSFRAISYLTGEELWRHDVKWTHSYSRDADGSALMYNNLLYAALENSLLTIFDPKPENARIQSGMLQPVIKRETKLYTLKDVAKHKGNVVTESSPAILGNHLYISSGSGHVWGYNLNTDSIDWDFYIGSDMDGSPVVTSDSCIIVTAEKQYIEGAGGAFKLNPALPPEEAVVWFLPTGDCNFAGWEGGIIGSAGINDGQTNPAKKLALIHALDKNLYLVEHNRISTDSTLGPNLKYKYPKPTILDKVEIGRSISTPLIINDKAVVACYAGIYLFQISDENKLVKLDYYPAECEATPFVHNRKIYIASRNGYLYCLGD